MAKKTIVKAASPAANDMRKWQAEEDLRTLRRAEEIRADKTRVRMAQRVAQQEVAALSRIAKTPAGMKGKR